MTALLKTTAVSPFISSNMTSSRFAWTSSLDGATVRVGFKFMPITTSQVTHVAWYQDIAGDMTGISWIGDIRTDNGSNYPSNTVLGTATAATAYRTTDGYSAEIALAAGTGALTLNTPYWFVVRDGGGDAPGGSNFARATYVNFHFAFGRLAKYNGSNWTAVTPVDADGYFYVKHADGNITGLPVTSAFAVTSAGTTTGKIYDDTRMGIRHTFTQAQQIDGFNCRLAKTGTPGDLTVILSDSAGTQLDSIVIDADHIIDLKNYTMRFPAAHTIAANSNFYITFTCDGTSSDYYQMYTLGVVDGYADAMVGNLRFVYGDTTDPTAMTVSTTEVPSVLVMNLAGPAGGATGAGGAFNAGFN